MRKKTRGEQERDLGLPGQENKAATPKMGGILIIIISLLIPVLLFNKLNNIYVLLMIFTTLWLGALGFVDDYIKCVKHNKDGISEKTKLLGQIVLGIVVGVVMYFHPAVGIKENYSLPKQVTTSDEEKWGVWAAAVIVIVLVALWNEHAINNKEKRNKQLQDQYDSIVVEFKIRNEVIYTEDEEHLRKEASDMGFVPTTANGYYKIEMNHE